MIRSFRTYALLILSILLGACATVDSGKSASSAVDRIMSRGVLRFGLSANQPPFNMLDKKGDVIGMDVDLSRALASSLQVEPEFLVMPFGQLLPLSRM